MRDVFRVMTSDRSGHNDYFPFFFVLECAEMRLPVRAPCINCAAMSYSYRLSFFFFYFVRVLLTFRTLKMASPATNMIKTILPLVG